MTMAAISPMQEDLEFDHGTFDSAAFTSQTLASWQNLAGGFFACPGG